MDNPTMTMEEMYASDLWKDAQAAKAAWEAIKDTSASDDKKERAHDDYAAKWQACWRAVGFGG